MREHTPTPGDLPKQATKEGTPPQQKTSMIGPIITTATTTVVTASPSFSQPVTTAQTPVPSVRQPQPRTQFQSVITKTATQAHPIPSCLVLLVGQPMTAESNQISSLLVAMCVHAGLKKQQTPVAQLGPAPTTSSTQGLQWRLRTQQAQPP